MDGASFGAVNDCNADGASFGAVNDFGNHLSRVLAPPGVAESAGEGGVS